MLKYVFFFLKKWWFGWCGWILLNYWDYELFIKFGVKGFILGNIVFFLCKSLNNVFIIFLTYKINSFRLLSGWYYFKVFLKLKTVYEKRKKEVEERE